MTSRQLIWVSCALCCATFHAMTVHGEQNSQRQIIDDSWQVIFIQGQRVGYAHSVVWETGTDNEKRIWSESLTQMTVARFGGKLTMTVTQIVEEDVDGNLISFSLDTDNPPISHTRITGRVEGDHLEITNTAAGETKESTLPWDPEVKSPVYQERMMKEDPVSPGETQSLRVFDPQFLKVGTLTLTGQHPQPTELLDGSTPTLARTLLVHSLVPGLQMTIAHDSQGTTLKTETNLLGMVSYTVNREEAVKEIAGAQLDLALDSMVKVKAVSRAHERAKLTYEISLQGPQKELSLPESDTQSITRIDDHTLNVTVSAVELDREPPPSTEQTVEVEAIYRGSSRYLECDHPKVRQHADAAAGDLQHKTAIARAMEKYVHDNLTEKNFSTALGTAAEVASSLEGDCTEHAMLLAAMLRVREIPSRITVGLVYSERHSAFVGHMWTEAFFNGHWVPLDATIARGGTGAGHLKFSDSSLADEGPSPIAVFIPLVGMINHLKIRVTGDESAQ